MLDDLFRQEALVANRDRLIGETLQLKPPGLYSVSVCSAIFACAFLLYGFLGQYARKERVTGSLVPNKGLVEIFSSRSGIVTKSQVKSGDHVTKDQALFLISGERISSEGLSVEASAISALVDRKNSLMMEREQINQISALDVSNAAQKLTALSSETEQLGQQEKNQNLRIANTRGMLERDRALVQDRFFPPSQLDQRIDALLEQQNGLRDVIKAKLQVERQVLELNAYMRSAKMRLATQQSVIMRAVHEIDAQLADFAAQREVEVSAPISGTVAMVARTQGQRTVTEAALAAIIPDGSELEAELLVHSAAIGLIRTGQDVYLRYDAFPYQKFGAFKGIVTNIDKAPGRITLPTSAADNSSTVYRIRVRLEEQYVMRNEVRIDLQPGITLEADIAVENRRIIAWLFEPIIGIVGKL